jgi:hypothetical protein
MPENRFHPSIQALLEFFETAHLDRGLALVVTPFGHLARELAVRAPADPETSVAIRKLVEAKDCAVRAAIRARRQTQAAMTKELPPG